MVAMFSEFHGLTHYEMVNRLIGMALAAAPPRLQRECAAVEDKDFLLMGIRRVFDRYESGRDFIQALCQEGEAIARTTYFETLHSDRRIKMAEAVGDVLCAQLSRWFSAAGVNHLSVFPELTGRAVFAADGHYNEHACHSHRDEKGSKVASGTIYGVNLASGLVFAVCATISGASMHPNEWALLKKHHQNMLRRMSMARMGWDSKSRPLLVYDKAGADAEYMQEKSFLDRNGFDMISRRKENMRLAVVSIGRFDKDDKVNAGVMRDDEVRLANGVELRMVTYRCPESGELYEFITTERKLRPGVIAWLYFMRWRIEKVFDVFEQKLGQKKAWVTDTPANSARPCQAGFICMAYNILLFVQTLLREDAGVTDVKSAEKREKELEERQSKVEAHNVEVEAKAKASGASRPPRNLRSLHPLTEEIVRQWHQMTRQFIRCFRNLFRAEKTLAECFKEYERYQIAYL